MNIFHLSDSGEIDKLIYLNSQNKTGHDIIRYETGYDEEHALYLSSVSDRINGNVAKISSRDFYKFFTGEYTSSNSSKSNLLNDIDNSPYPICVRYKSNYCIVIERPPFKVPVRMRYGKSSYYSKSSSKGDEFEVEIWIPWSVVILSTTKGFFKQFANDQTNVNVSLFYRDAPLSSFDDFICPAYTPNVFSDAKLCLGATQDNFYRKVSSKEIDISNISQVYNYMITEYFSGGWNMDVITNGYSLFCNSLLKRSNVEALLKRASEMNNKYILSLDKKFSFISKYFTDSETNRPLQNSSYRMTNSFGSKRTMRMYLNYLSLLSLEETFAFVREVHKDGTKQDNKYSRATHSLRGALENLDPSFAASYGGSTDREIDFIEETNETLKSALRKACVSASSNETALHSWRLEIIYNIDDFLNFASEKILKEYHRYSYFFSSFDVNGKERFYKKNIKYTLSDTDRCGGIISHLLCDYRLKLKEAYPDDFHSAIASKIEEISEYFKNLNPDAGYKHNFVIDLTELKMVLDKQRLNAGVSQ